MTCWIELFKLTAWQFDNNELIFRKYSFKKKLDKNKYLA